MSTVQTLIGKRFETILQELYPELSYIGNDGDIVPDFEHPLFLAEAKVCFDQSDYAAHLKQYQIEGFKRFVKQKPVIYIIGFHTFEDSMKRLAGLSVPDKEAVLAQEMKISKLYVVDNRTIENVWRRRNYVCKKGHIQDCTLREGHLIQIIEDSEIKVAGRQHNARHYYTVPSELYLFSGLELDVNKGLRIGHIMPSHQQEIIDFFHR